MKAFFKIIVMITFIAIAALIIGCGIGGIGGPDEPLQSEELSFNIQGAKAIAGTSNQSRLIQEKALKANSKKLVKIKSDGKIESIINMGEGTDWVPEVRFIHIGNDKSVYICFDVPYTQSMYDEDTEEYYDYTIQFVRVFMSDNHYEVIWPPDPYDWDYNNAGIVETWSWDGIDRDPIVKDSEGKLYFKVSSWNSSGAVEHIYTYDPEIGGEPIQVTPSNASMIIESFAVDSKQHIFIKGQNSDYSSYFLRYYTPGYISPGTIYYSSSSYVWVNNYIPDPSGNALIMSGQNIRGMSGLIRANIIDWDTVTYDLIYPESLNVELAYYDNCTYEPDGVLIKNLTATNKWVWDGSVTVDGNDGGQVDTGKVLEKVSRYFYIGDVYYKTDQESRLNSIDLNASHPTYYYYTWGDYISSFPENFLNEFFNGKLIKTHLEEQGLNANDITFDDIGYMFYDSSGVLYGIYGIGWYAPSESMIMVIKLLDANGAKLLELVRLVHEDQFPSKIKIIDNWLYYRYAILDEYGQETGMHKLARLNLETGVEEEIMIDSTLSSLNLEIISYDVAKDNSTLYFSALDYYQNRVIFGKIDLDTKNYTPLETDMTFDIIRAL